MYLHQATNAGSAAIFSRTNTRVDFHSLRSCLIYSCRRAGNVCPLLRASSFALRGHTFGHWMHLSSMSETFRCCFFAFRDLGNILLDIGQEICAFYLYVSLSYFRTCTATTTSSFLSPIPAPLSQTGTRVCFQGHRVEVRGRVLVSAPPR